MVGGVKGIGGRAGSEQAAMPGEEMLESQIGHEVAGGDGDAVVI